MKRWTQFLLCLLLSASVWLIHNLSLKYTGVVTVSVLAKSSLKGRSQTASEPVTVNARCYATGFRLLRIRHSDSDVLVEINPEDFEYTMSDDKFNVSAANLSKYAADIFGSGVQLETFLNQGYGFSFPRENNRTVPVRPVVNVSFKPQYMAAGPMRIQPDSVVIYGSGSLLESVNAVLTRPVSVGDASKNVSGVARIVPVPGIRISESEVAWALDVVRYVELRSQVHINVRGAPAGVKLSVLPSTAEAVFRCRFPAKGNPAEVCEFYVDYTEFTGSISGSCVVRCDNLPQGVIDWSIDPEVVDCLEMEEVEE
ncbi:MAG: YbbR-like domain-containing protein [Bacteroidales bacterium]|nr:YbbR-like domain-containing protein [Bacteroidales bacterium]